MSLAWGKGVEASGGGLLQGRHLEPAGQPERRRGLVGAEGLQPGLEAGGVAAEAVHGLQQARQQAAAPREVGLLVALLIRPAGGWREYPRHLVTTGASDTPGQPH